MMPSDNIPSVSAPNDNPGMKPGDLVELDQDKAWDKLSSSWVGLYKRNEGSIDNPMVGWFNRCTVGLLLARVPRELGTAGTDTDAALVLVDLMLGWTSIHWLKPLGEEP